MEKRYFNNIKKEWTIYPYHFKTIDEMKNDYLKYVNESYPEENLTFDKIDDYEWRSYIIGFFSKNMDYLTGEDFKDENLSISDEQIYRLPGNYETYIISTAMLVKNEISPLYNMVSNVRKNIYENKVIKYNEAKNGIKEAHSICIYIKNKSELLKFDEMLFQLLNNRFNLYLYYSNDTPIYFIVSLLKIDISWLEGNENLEETGVQTRSYLNGVYEKIYYFENDKEEIENILKNKKIDYLPYYMKSPKNVYESINTKPDFFKQTYYRLPNSEELNDINNHNLTAKQVLDGFKYTIVGRGMMNSKNKDMIIQSIEKLINIDENNMEYKIALKMAQKITLK